MGKKCVFMDAQENIMGGLNVNLRPGELWQKGVTVFKIKRMGGPLKNSSGGRGTPSWINTVGLGARKEA